MTVVARSLRQLPDSPYAADERVVALTFDDAPGPNTAPVLDALAACATAATFFVVGTDVEARPELVARIAEEGHALGNRSWTHTRLEELDDAAVVDEFARTDALVTEITGKALHRARPPSVMSQAARLAHLVQRLGYTAVVGWSIDPGDGKDHDPMAITERVVDGLVPGTIVRVHAGAGEPRSTAEAVTRIVQAGHVLGYRFVTL